MGSRVMISESSYQSFLAIQPLGLLAVDYDAIPTKKYMQAAIAKSTALVRQIAQLLSQCAVVITARQVSDNRAARQLR